MSASPQKTIGLIGGMSWESTLVYYQLLNRGVRDRLGALHSASIVLVSLDFAQIEALQMRGDWDSATQILVDTAQRLERAGAQCVLICTNTMHKMADAVQAAISIPLLHIADATATALKVNGVQRPLLLGTRFTMEQTFYRGRLIDRYGFDVMTPDEAGRATVHDVIYDELCAGVISDSSREQYRSIIESAVTYGADSVILGCTEIGLLIQQHDVSVPVIDTTTAHVEAAVVFALAE
ncbi:MAG: aspartate/glutamate racemase family protein [Pseudomonadota bacterium]